MIKSVAETCADIEPKTKPVRCDLKILARRIPLQLCLCLWFFLEWAPANLRLSGAVLLILTTAQIQR